MYINVQPENLLSRIRRDVFLKTAQSNTTNVIISEWRAGFLILNVWIVLYFPFVKSVRQKEWSSTIRNAC